MKSASGGPPSAAKGSGRARLLVLLAVWGLAGAYASFFVNRGWVAHDEGTIAQSAERVLAGELPHRDYDEGYTGLLTYLHAAAFRLFGVRLSSLRLVLLVFFLLFVPALYAIASRLSSPGVAGLVTLLGVAWSVPNYFASLPSWYNLFFATFSILALLRHVETGHRRWLFAAGLCGGLSVLFKIIGLYSIAGALLFLAYREQQLSSARGPRRRALPFLLVKALACAAFLAFLLSLCRSRLGSMDVIHFVLPSAAVACLLLASEWRDGSGQTRERFQGLFRLLLPFAAGVLLPMAVFLYPYLATGSLAALSEGLFVRPARQLATARWSLPSPDSLSAALPYAIVLGLPTLISRRREGIVTLAAAVLLGLGLVFAAAQDVYQILWSSARSLAVVSSVVACLVLAAGAASLSPAKRQQLFLLAAMSALVSLVQFPFSAPIYFCYAAPLAALTILAIVAAQPLAPRRLHLCILVFYLLFGVLVINPSYIFSLGRRYEPYRADSPLALPRGGLRVPAREARAYEALTAAIDERSSGPYIYAAPDCPEVYFLSERRNPTRFFFDHLSDLPGRPEALLRILQERQINVVVLNRLPDFSPGPSAELRAALERRFPRALEIGKFRLMWRD